MKPRRLLVGFVTAGACSAISSCATIVNDPNIPLAVSFSDGSAGHCEFENKRGKWSTDVPTTNVMIRRSDDDLAYECTTKDGRDASGVIRSEMEGEKMAASVIFWDLGITDAITDKHRTYQGNVVIAVEPRDGGTTEMDAPTSNTETLEERLKRLESLKDQGLITAEEYESRRAEILQEL